MFRVTSPTHTFILNDMYAEDIDNQITQAEMRPYKQIAGNVNSVKIAIITSICSLISTGIIGYFVVFAKQNSKGRH